MYNLMIDDLMNIMLNRVFATGGRYNINEKKLKCNYSAEIL